MGKLAKTLLRIFACATAISALSIYYTHQLPTYETQTTTLCSYKHTGTYNYVAELKPNLIYNKTTLGPGEGTLTIEMVMLEDLAKIAEILARPILQTTTP